MKCNHALLSTARWSRFYKLSECEASILLRINYSIREIVEKSYLNDALFDGLGNSFGHGMHMELFVNVFDMKAYGIIADVAHITDHFTIHPVNQMSKDLPFPVRQHDQILFGWY